MPFDLPIIRLAAQPTTYVKVDGWEVLIQKIPKQELWKISTPILKGRGEFPKETFDCLRIVQQMNWGNEGMLEIDALVGTIHWTHEVRPEDFSTALPRFLRHAQEWSEILEEELVSK